MTTWIGYFELGKSYFTSANHLCDSVASKESNLGFGHPIDFLYAHAIELMLKGCILEKDPSTEIENYRHNLLQLYDEVRCQKLVGNMIAKAERAVRDRWKQHLRSARDKLQAKLMRFGLSEKDTAEFGTLSNAQIGDELPSLRDQNIWLSDRHSSDGSRFRYLKTGVDSRPRIKAFGLSDDVVRLSCRWACAEMYQHFRSFHASNKKQRE